MSTLVGGGWLQRFTTQPCLPLSYMHFYLIHESVKIAKECKKIFISDRFIAKSLAPGQPPLRQFLAEPPNSRLVVHWSGLILLPLVRTAPVLCMYMVFQPNCTLSLPSHSLVQFCGGIGTCTCICLKKFVLYLVITARNRYLYSIYFLYRIRT